MKTPLIILILAVIHVWGAESMTTIAKNTDCVESLENEVIGIIYQGSMKNAPMEDLTGRINRSFERKCDTDPKEVIPVKTKITMKDCVRKLENQIIKLVQSSATNQDQEETVRFLARHISQNFDHCKSLEK